jgi:peptide chain release factor 2
MKYLRSRIYESKLEQNEKLSEINKTKKDIAWGVRFGLCSPA